MGIARGTCLGASVVHVSASAVADDSPISDEAGPAAERGCVALGFSVLLVNVCFFKPYLGSSTAAKG